MENIKGVKLHMPILGSTTCAAAAKVGLPRLHIRETGSIISTTHSVWSTVFYKKLAYNPKSEKEIFLDNFVKNLKTRFYLRNTNLMENLNKHRELVTTLGIMSKFGYMLYETNTIGGIVKKTEKFEKIFLFKLKLERLSLTASNTTVPLRYLELTIFYKIYILISNKRIITIFYVKYDMISFNSRYRSIQGSTKKEDVSSFYGKFFRLFMEIFYPDEYFCHY
ncbi:hypothetical protein BpHYR1_024162 [Brachionus plicatilis]|uniref:Uncharacterized protein n=1 Tax=Brachionus plicatilis TaxID=10195 RepID=A0A3M7QXV5_BRAPC|nr:hypothetical protein BpHYR1_024162 [Brachionus plicatilis]